MDQINIIFADDQQMVREGLRELFGQQRDMHILGEASDGVMAVAMTLAMKPDVLLLDLTMPEMSGFEVLKQLRESAPDIRVVFFTMNQNKEYLFQAFKSGAIGYVTKGGGADQLLAAIRAAYISQHYLSSSLRTNETIALLKNLNPDSSATVN